MTDFKWSKAVNARKGEGRLRGRHTIFRQINCLLLTCRRLAFSAGNTLVQDSMHSCSCVYYPVSLTDERQGILYTLVCRNMVIVTNDELGHVMIFRQNDRVLDISVE